MTGPNESSESHPFNYWRVAWHSALAAGIGLGLPLVLMFWMVILANALPSTSMNNVLSLLQNTWYPFANEQQASTPVHDFLMALQTYITPASIALSLGILGWAWLFSRITGYRPWWNILAASLAGVFIGKAPIDWLDGWIQQASPPYGWSLDVRFAVFLSLSVLYVAMSTGLALSLILRNWKASLVLTLSSGLASVIAVIVADMILNRLGIRVGHGNLAMPKLTAVGTLAAATAGGTVLGVLFTHYCQRRSAVSTNH